MLMADESKPEEEAEEDVNMFSILGKKQVQWWNNKHFSLPMRQPSSISGSSMCNVDMGVLLSLMWKYEGRYIGVLFVCKFT